MDKVAALTEILDQNPTDTFARYGLAMELSNQERLAEAVAQFDRLLADHPEYTAGYFMAAQTLVKAGDSETARRRLTAGIASARAAGNQHAEREMSAMLDELQG